MAANPQAQVNSGGSGEDDNEDFNLSGGQAQIDNTGTDDLLDEIDSLLESNAEEFVRSYVQKGGQ
ncbi:Prokaryotic ubiquitin-like protein Pup [Corynebacterium occultum]|uniref:Prokaryotic ubiquitin-like protein Pup n=1 Tax=Corynebacterium occultum TaxID=2675219 RepID=A0A6B8WLY1_9CORY|nr:ubiquitin-like protein Pup [Corynebacterium occultum]QGU07398.1 Prokaryotic ubiquitin-like protein Pup [Corynebacterium occultum]